MFEGTAAAHLHHRRKWKAVAGKVNTRPQKGVNITDFFDIKPEHNAKTKKLDNWQVGSQTEIAVKEVTETADPGYHELDKKLHEERKDKSTHTTPKVIFEEKIVHFDSEESLTQDQAKVVWQEQSPGEFDSITKIQTSIGKNAVKHRFEKDCQPDEQSEESPEIQNSFNANLILTELGDSTFRDNGNNISQQADLYSALPDFIHGSPVVGGQRHGLKRTPIAKRASCIKPKKRSRLSVGGASKNMRLIREASTIDVSNKAEVSRALPGHQTTTKKRNCKLGKLLEYDVKVDALKEKYSKKTNKDNYNISERPKNVDFDLQQLNQGDLSHVWLLGGTPQSTTTAIMNHKRESLAQHETFHIDGKQVENNTLKIQTQQFKGPKLNHSRDVFAQVSVNKTTCNVDRLNSTNDQVLKNVESFPRFKNTCSNAEKYNDSYDIVNEGWGADLGDEDALELAEQAEISYSIRSQGTGLYSHKLKENFSSNKVNHQFPESSTNKLSISTRCVIESVTDSADSKGLELQLLLRPIKDRNRDSEALNSKHIVAHLRCTWVHGDYKVGDIVNLIVEDFWEEEGKLHCSLGSWNGQTNETMPGFIIHFPDFIIAPTQIGAANQCLRRAFLSKTIFDRSDSDLSPYTVKGNIWHQFFETLLNSESVSAEILKDAANKAIKAHLKQLLAVDMSEKDVNLYLEETFSWTKEWLHRYFPSKLNPNSVTDSRGPKCDTVTITDVVDVEEYIESGNFGLNGYIDASVRIRNFDGSFSTDTIAPLELKSGKERLEHQPQVMLYLLLMEERYGKGIDFGLIQYLKTKDKDTSLTVIKRNWSFLEAFIASRNQLVCSLFRGSLPPMTEVRSQCASCFQRTNCALCHAAENSTMGNGPSSEEVISSFAGSREGFQEKSARQAFINDTKHLSIQDCEFLYHWARLLDLEASELNRNSNKNVDLDTHGMQTSVINRIESESKSTLKTKSKPSKEIDDLILREITSKPTGKGVFYSFSRSDGKPVDCPYPIGEMLKLYISNRDMGAVANRVHLYDVSDQKIIVHLDKPLRRGLLHPQVECLKWSSLERTGSTSTSGQSMDSSSPCSPWLRWKLKKQEIESTIPRMRSFLYKMFSNVASDANISNKYPKKASQNLELSKIASNLRRLIVRLETPKRPRELNARENEIVTREAKVFKLNAEQIRAVRSAVGCQDYSLILGMPGAGKTTCVAAMIRALASLNKRVLLTSYTNTAVDNVLLKLLPYNDIIFMRVGREDRVHDHLRPYVPGGESYPAEEVKDYSKWVDCVLVMGTTALGVNDALINQEIFDVCIVDEAGQITLPASIGPLLRARTFVLVGDPNQLPPLVTSPAAEEGGLSISLFAKLAEKYPQAVTDLPVQYRMAEDIQMLPNLLVYQDKLRCGNQIVAKQKLEMGVMGTKSKGDSIHNSDCSLFNMQTCHTLLSPNESWKLDSSLSEWLLFSLNPNNRVVFLDTSRETSAIENAQGDSINNPAEAQAILSLTTKLLSFGVPSESIGLISPYNSQVSLLRNLLYSENIKGVECLTVDKAQGRDKDCIVVSFVRSNRELNAGKILTDIRRINVAITRAKSKLVLIGDANTLGTIPCLKKILNECERRGWLHALPAQSKW